MDSETEARLRSIGGNMCQCKCVCKCCFTGILPQVGQVWKYKVEPAGIAQYIMVATKLNSNEFQAHGTNRGNKLSTLTVTVDILNRAYEFVGGPQ